MLLNLKKDPNTGETIRKKGMTRDEYLDAVFNAHRVTISEAFGANAKAEFKQSIEDIIGTDYYGKRIRTVEQAFTVLRRERVFAPAALNFAESVLGRVRDLGGSQALLDATRDARGHFQKLDPTQLRWDKDGRFHWYRGLKIYTRTSPYAAMIEDKDGNVVWKSENWDE